MTVDKFNFKPVQKMIEHTRAFQKIQDGCDFRCYYCAVPYARGPARSANFQRLSLRQECLWKMDIKR
jgi:threonylcarbamoyladenosine tRNA methylthiotransferase MtaB